MQWGIRFLDAMTNNADFRGGFFLALLVAFGVWLLWALGYYLHVQWLKIRQFFEPTKIPAKPAVTTGPSPASIMLGCMGRALLTAFIIAVAILVFARFAGTF